MEYKKLKITKGSGGWGGPIMVEPTEIKSKIVYITGGAKPEVAVTIGKLYSWCNIQYSWWKNKRIKLVVR